MSVYVNSCSGGFGGSNIFIRQSGQHKCFLDSHLSRHLEWNTCSHFSPRTSSADWMTSKHITLCDHLSVAMVRWYQVKCNEPKINRTFASLTRQTALQHHVDPQSWNWDDSFSKKRTIVSEPMCSTTPVTSDEMLPSLLVNNNTV